MEGGVVAFQNAGVVLAGGAYENTYFMAALFGDGQVGVLEYFIGEFEEHALLRVYLFSFAGGDGEEFGVEVANVLGFNVATTGGCRVEFGRYFFILKKLLVAGVGEVGDGVHTVVEKSPVFLRGVGVAGEAGGNADDGNVCTFHGGAVAGLVEGFGCWVGVVKEENCQFVYCGVLVDHCRIDGFSGEVLQLPNEFQNTSGG